MSKNVGDQGVWGLEELEDKVGKPTQWGIVGSRTYKGFPSTHETLPAGAYTVTMDRNDNQAIFKKKSIKTDEIMRFKDSLNDRIFNEIQTFWGTKKKFKDVGVLHRRGYLLYGPQGTGKTSIVQQVMTDVIENGGLVMICENPKFFNQALSTFRRAEPNRQLVCIFEDIDAIIKRYGEDELLSILDGANMVDFVLNIATTNYPELLDRRIVSRPRRFDRVIKILNPSKKVRTAYLRKKLPKKYNLAKWVKATGELSFAGITEAIISVVCLGNSLDETIEILTDLEKGHPSSEDFGKEGGLGFSSDGKEAADGNDDMLRIPGIDVDDF